MQQLAGNRFGMCAGHNRNDELIGMNRALQFLQHLVEPLRLNGQDDKCAGRFGFRRGYRVSSQGCFAIIFKHAHAVLRVKFLAPRGPRMAANDLLRGDELLSQQARNYGFGHHATADKRQPRVFQRVGCFSLFLCFSFRHMAFRTLAGLRAPSQR